MNSKSHILSAFDKDLNTLRDKLIQMVTTVDNSLNASITGLLDSDASRCNKVIADDDVIDDLEAVIDSLAMDILLRYNPVASDLRFVVSSMSIAKNLERIGDHAAQIAKQAKKLEGEDIMAPDLEYIKDLFVVAIGLFGHAKQAILDNSTASAEDCIKGEENMRFLNKKISKIFVKIMSSEASNVSSYLSLVMVARSIERFARLSCNISEDIIYIATAENVRR